MPTRRARPVAASITRRIVLASDERAAGLSRADLRGLGPSAWVRMVREGLGGWSRAALLVVVVAASVALVPTWVGASANLPLHHWVYQAIERLTALGIIDRAMVVTKPYSRKLAAKYVARAIERIRSDAIRVDGREAVAEPLLDRLIKELEPELVALGAVRAPSAAPSAALDAGKTMPGARWPWGAIRVGGRIQLEGDGFFVGKETVRLRENRMGQYYANGPQVQGDLRAWVEVGDVVALTADPRYISNVHALGLGATNNTNSTYLQELNAKLTFWNIALQVGRGSNWWGPGYRGSLLLTDHAFPLDMVQVGSEEPFRLPWVLGALGHWRINAFWGQLERDRDFPRANVFGLRVSYLPASWLELGAARLTQFGGRGQAGQSFPKTILEVYGAQPNQGGPLQVNEQSMVDVRARVPRVPYLVPFPGGLEVYGEIGSEDKWSQLPFPSRVAVLGGLYVPQVFAGDTLDLRIEYADTDLGRRRHPELVNIWYNNGTYVSGMRHRGFPLGHWMGSDGIDLFIRTSRLLRDDLQVGLQVEWTERGRGQSPFERKRESGVDLVWWLSPRMQWTVAYTYQQIKSPGVITSLTPFVETFSAGVTSRNHLLWTVLAVEF